MARGVLVDRGGYFLGAFQWPDNQPQPNFNGPNKDGAPNQTVFLLTSETALAVDNSSGRWNFKSKAWEYPTEERWIVRQRRDIPDLWTLSGKRLVWPERPPRLPDGAKIVSVAPPDTGRGSKPVWDDSIDGWRAPKRVAVLNASGEVENFVTAYRGDDVPSGTTVELDSVLEAENEAGLTVPVGQGDEITVTGDGTLSATIKRIPNYRRVPVRLLEQVLTDRGLAADFVAFVQSKGFTIEQVRNVGTISLKNKLLREFVIAQGFTMKQAYTALQKAAQDLLQAERATERDISEEI